MPWTYQFRVGVLPAGSALATAPYVAGVRGCPGCQISQKSLLA